MTTANELKLRFAYYVGQTEMPYISDGYFHAAIGTVAKAAGGDDNRKLVMKALCGKTSSRQMTAEEKYAFTKFAAPAKIGGHWTSKHGMFLIDMCHLLLEDLARQEGQLEFFEASGTEPSDSGGG